MTCPPSTKLQLLLNDELPAAELAETEAHIEQCPGCKARLHFWLMTGAEGTDPPAGGGPRYRIMHLHAQGGLGEVFMADDMELNRPVALKRMQERFRNDAGSRRRFLQETEITARLEHPSVVPVYGLIRDEEGNPCYAMRFIRGEGLDAAIRRFHEADGKGRDAGERSLALRQLLSRFTTICNAIAYAHSRGILHRDLKPSNVMLGKYGETLVVDWGLAKPIPRDDAVRTADEATLTVGLADGDNATLIGQAVGTPAYMSPEQASGQWGRVGASSDIYSLGAILYTLLTGQPPFVMGSVREKLEQVQRGAFPRPRAIKACPPALEAICLKAMALRPEERYSTAMALAADVEHWLADEPVTVYREPLPARLRRWGRRHRAWVAAAAALVLTATAALAVGLILVNAEKNRTAEAQRETEKALARVTDEQRKTEQALTAEKTALAQSRKWEQTAAEQGQLSLETMSAVVASFDTQLQHLPNMQGVRLRMLQQAQQGLKKVAVAADAAGRINHLSIWTHFELGMISMRMGEPTAKAEGEYELAYRLARAFAEAEPDNVVARRDLSVSYLKLGEIQARLGDTEAALKSYERYHEVITSLADADPESRGLQRDVSIALNRLGDAYMTMGNTEAALKRYQRSYEITRKLSADSPHDPQAQRDLSVTSHRLGDLQMARGANDAALETFSAILAGAQKRADVDPNNAESQRDLFVAHLKLGDIRTKMGDDKSALEALTAAQRMANNLAVNDPFNAEAQRDLCGVHDRLGDVRLKLGDTAAAMADYKIGLNIAEKRVGADPRNASAQRDFLGMQTKLGDAMLASGDSAAALDLFKSARKKAQELRTRDPRNAHFRRNLAVALTKLGDVNAKLGDVRAALEVYTELQAVTQELADADPRNVEAQRDLAVAHEKVGDVHWQFGDAAAALREYGASAVIRQQLVAEHPNDVVARRELMKTYNTLGERAHHTGAFTAAADWFAKSLAEPRRLDKPELFAQQVQFARYWLSVCRAAQQVLADLTTLDKQPEKLRGPVLQSVAFAHIGRKERDKAVAAADRLAAVGPDPFDVYVASCAFAQISLLDATPKQKEDAANRALALLEQAVARGYKNIEQLKTDRNLGAVRDRDEFKALVRELEAKAKESANKSNEMK
jgi:tetratricopeptide (TPR) repeat protein/tRNA A-37 threonylcarbamoyl transferase component Bud32